MRRVAVFSTSRLAGSISAVAALHVTQAQQSSNDRGGSRGERAPRGPGRALNRIGGSARGGPPSPQPDRPVYLNFNGDSELSTTTRAAMRDDAVVLAELFRYLPPNGAISIKSLSALINPEVQEAVSERHNGLLHFLQRRKQFFVVKARPSDNVLFVAATPLAGMKFATREQQNSTLRAMMGLNERPPRRPLRGGGGGGRGGRPAYDHRGGRGGAAPSARSSNSDRGGSGGYDSRGPRGAMRGQLGGRGARGRYRGGAMGSRAQSYGTGERQQQQRR